MLRARLQAAKENLEQENGTASDWSHSNLEDDKVEAQDSG
jgi:hypothetical protein